ncbi:MAG: hypothetical protein ABIQ02_05800 [Saprospiraceae bacterium]
MEDNVGEKISENPVNTKSENISNEIIPIDEIDNVAPKQETENMEEHYHPDLHHKPKPGKEYLLEFLMIFLAVTMGFFAESFREHLTERTKEREFIKSMIEDLKSDSAFLDISINQRILFHITWMDSTIHLLQMPALNGKDREVYRAFFLATSWTYNFHPSQRTQQEIGAHERNL